MAGFLGKKTIAWYISCASLVLALIGLIIYVARGGNTYSPVSGAAVTVWVIGLICNAAILVKNFRIGQFVPYLFYVIVLGILVNSEMLFVSNVLMDLDKQSLDGGFFGFVVCLALAILTGFVSCCTELEKQ